MKLILITQDEPFYLKENLKYLLEILPNKTNVVGCIVSKVSPYGKKESFSNKAFKTLNIFGIKFFLYYTFKYIISKLFYQSVGSFLKTKNIENIKIIGSINSENNIKFISSYKPDLLVSILGNELFKKPLINLAPKGCINLHTSLLPKYRGLMPTFWVLKNNEKFTGVSVFFVDEGIDSGPIIVQKKIEIGNKSQKDLIFTTKKVGMECISKAIDIIEKGNYKLISNDNNKKSYYSFPTKEDVLEFNKIGKKFF